MSRGRSLAFLSFLILLISLPPVRTVQAGPVVDPFLERLRSGAFADPSAAVPEIAGLREEILDPTTLDPAWAEAARAYFEGRRRRWDNLATWRLVAPALGDRDAARRWMDARERRYRELLTDRAPAPADPTVTWHLEDLVERNYLRAIQQSEYTRASLAYAVADSLALHDPHPARALVRRLRRDLLPLPGREAEAVWWPELLALGPGDALAGMRLRRAASGGADLPAPPEAHLRWLLSTHPWPAPAVPVDDPEAGAALAAIWPRNDAYAAWRAAAPPDDPLYQRLWVRARRRAASDAAATARLLASPGLNAESRAYLLRRDADDAFTAKDFSRGAGRIAEGFALARSEGRDDLARLFAEEALRGVAQARALGRDDLVSRLDSVVEGGLPAAESTVWNRRTGALDGPSVPCDGTELERAADLVRAGLAPDLKPSPESRAAFRVARDHAWRSWLAWGRTLPGEGLRSSDLAYLAAVDGARRAATANARFALSCAAVGTWLHASPDRDLLLEWALTRDLERLAGGKAAAAASPVPSLLAGVRVDDPSERVRRHALYGLCLAVDDPRGQVAVIAVTPTPGLAAADRLHLYYPVPAEPAVARAAGEVEAAWLLAVARNESLFDSSVRSRAGALGWLQVMPFHYAATDFRDGRVPWRTPAVAVAKGAGLLAGNARRYDGDPYRATAAYNAGPGAVARWDAQLGGAAARAIFLAWIGYDETRRYVEKVLIDRQVYRWILIGHPVDCGRGAGTP